MKLTFKSLGLIGILGGVGGLINGWLCYAQYPVPVSENPSFRWAIIPLGYFHGTILAIISAGLVFLFWKRKLFLRLIGLLVGGYIAGWISFIPIYCYVNFFHDPSPQRITVNKLAETILWPFTASKLGEIVYLPYNYFGLVSVVCYFFLTICGLLSCQRLSFHLLIGVLSGSLGSLWWWISFKPWYFSLIHGMIWGMLVGFGFWKIRVQK